MRTICIIEGFQKLGSGLAQARVAPVGSDGSQRGQNKAALVHLGMREREPGLVQEKVAVAQQVQVNDTRPPPNPTRKASEPALDLLKFFQQRPGPELRLDSGDAVQEGALGWAADWRVLQPG